MCPSKPPAAHRKVLQVHRVANDESLKDPVTRRGSDLSDVLIA
jgi:hypothetical protein